MMTARELQRDLIYILANLDMYSEEVEHKADYTMGMSNSQNIIKLLRELTTVRNTLTEAECRLSVIADREEGIIWKSGK